MGEVSVEMVGMIKVVRASGREAAMAVHVSAASVGRGSGGWRGVMKERRQWSRPDVQGENQCPRARQSGVAIDQYWFVVGGQCDKNEVSGTSLFNMKTHRWSVINEGTSALACQGMTLVSSVYKGEYFLLSFGGFRNCYRNEITVLKSSLITNLKSSHGTDLKSSQARLIKRQQPDKTFEKLLSEAALDEWMRTVWHLPLKLSVDSSNDSSRGEASVEAKYTLGMKTSQDVETLLHQQEIDESGKKNTELGENYISELSGGAEASAKTDKKNEACSKREAKTGLHEQELYEPRERNFESTKSILDVLQMCEEGLKLEGEHDCSFKHILRNVYERLKFNKGTNLQ